MVTGDCKREPGLQTKIDTIDRIPRKVDVSKGSDVSQDKSLSPLLHKRKRSFSGTDVSGILRKSDESRSRHEQDEVEGSMEVFRSSNEDAEIARRRRTRAEILRRYQELAREEQSDTPILASNAVHTIVDSKSPEISSGTPGPDDQSNSSFLIQDLHRANTNEIHQNELSAADFDADADRIREHEAHRIRTERLDGADDTAVRATSQAHKAQAEGLPDGDDDMFADLPEEFNAATSKVAGSARQLDETVLDSWADTEGYYRIMIGELLDEQYAVSSILGKGVFASVVRAVDQSTGEAVAVKIVRHNDLMKKAGHKEIAILERLMAADPDDRRHIVRLRRTFEHRGHLCLVFELLSLNLREVLKKFGRDIGINLKAVRAYGQQIFMALSLMRKCSIMHADLKPDNILVNESRTLLKICDLGSASDTSESTHTPYLASRFYRAPEVILGLPYDTSMDIWAVGCTLYEMFTGKILFPGRSNNQMLRMFMECRGKFPAKLLKKGVFVPNHFDDQLNFLSVDVDRTSGEQLTRVLNISKATKDFRSRLLVGAGSDERALLVQFIDLLEKTTDLDASRRITAGEALKHPFMVHGK